MGIHIHVYARSNPTNNINTFIIHSMRQGARKISDLKSRIALDKRLGVNKYLIVISGTTSASE